MLAGERLGGVHELTGPRAISMDEVAAILDVRYEPATARDFASMLEGFGVPADDAIELAHAFAETFDGRSAPTTTGVPDLLGRPARSFEEFARTAYAAGGLSLAGAGSA